MIYQPREDSFFLQKYVRKYAFGRVLDLGTGSGIQAEAAAKKRKVKSVTASDLSQEAINYCKNKIKNKKINFLVADLFNHKKLKNKCFETIIFNPPYLPVDKGIKDQTIYGGKRGCEVIERFLDEAAPYLKPQGIILMVFSSLTKKKMVDKIITDHLFEFKELERLKLPFEELYCYLIKKSSLLEELNKRKIKRIKYFAKGKRGLIYSGEWKDKKIVIKLIKSRFLSNLKKEVKYLKILNKAKIGPKLLFSKKNYEVCQFLEGDFIIDFIKKENQKSKIKKIIKNVLNQCFVLDQFKINKKEMHRPVKHLIINYPRVTLLDFERAYKTKKPKNVSQFCQFIFGLKNLLKEKGFALDFEKIIPLIKKYKKERNKRNLEKIISQIK